MPNNDVPIARTLEVFCPAITSAITFPKDRTKSDSPQVRSMAPSGCLKGQCAWWIIGKQKCAIVVIAEGMGK